MAFYVSDGSSETLSACIKQTTTIRISAGTGTGVDALLLKNGLHVKNLANRIGDNIGEPVDYNPPPVDGVSYVVFEFYEGDSLLCTLFWDDSGINERIKVTCNGDEQWYAWAGSDITEHYRKELLIRYNAKQWNMQKELERWGCFWPVLP